MTLAQETETLKASGTSHWVSRAMSLLVGSIPYGHQANVTRMSHARSVDVKDLNSMECMAQIDRLAQSPPLRNSTALCNLLVYLARHTLKTSGNQLKEFQIATEVLGRQGNFDPQTDSSVRTQVGRLRSKLSAYYKSEGSHDHILVDIPKGGYSLSFKRNPSGPKHDVVFPMVLHPTSAIHPRQRWLLTGLVVAALAIGYCAALWSRDRASYRALNALQDKPAVAALWSPILDNRTDIVLADPAFGLVQLIGKKSLSLDDYLSDDYTSHIPERDPEMRAALHLIASWNLGSTQDFKVARQIVEIDPTGKKVYLYDARHYTADLIRQDNVILIGGQFTNPWDELFQNRSNFTLKFPDDGLATVVNRAPAAGEKAIYTESLFVTGYCVVAFMPSLEHNRSVLLIEGTSAEATEAAEDFLFSEDQISHFLKMLHTKKFPYFEALLKVAQIKGTPVTTTIEAYRSSSSLR